LKANALKQTAHVAGRALVQVQIVSAGLTGYGKPGFEPFQLDSEDGRAANDAALSLAHIIAAAKVRDV
jgi:hypothetical protein